MIYLAGADPACVGKFNSPLYGIVVFTLPLGDYRIVEYLAPQDYIFDRTAHYDASLTAEGQEFVFGESVKNYKDVKTGDETPLDLWISMMTIDD